MKDKKSGFDDIVLEKNPKSEKMKKILFRAIILIIVFLAVMIIMKLINDPKEQLAKDEIIPPPPSQAKQNFENTPIIQEKQPNDEYANLLNDIKEETNTSSKIFADPNELAKNEQMPPKAAEELAQKELDKELKNEQKIEQKKEQKIEQKNDAKTIVHEAFVKPGSTPAKESKKQSKESKKVVQKVETPKELFSNIGIKNEGELKPGKYIQVFSVLKLDPKAKALVLLRAKNYKYLVYKITRDGKELHKILIGPIPANKLEAKLKKIRKEISKGAYAFSIK